jgi:hypothetical protein
MDSQSRRTGFEKFIEQNPRPSRPENFDPKTANNSDLFKYGYLPRAPHDAPSKLKDLWEHVTSLPFRIVTPKFTLVDTPAKRPPFPQRPPSVVQRNVSTPGWAGATIPSPPEGETFTMIGAEWTVPSVGAPWQSEFSLGAQESTDMMYAINAWVGLQTPQTNASGISPAPNIGAAIGTSSTCTIVPGLLLPTNPSVQIWIQWQEMVMAIEPSQETDTNFTVDQGDSVWGIVCDLTTIAWDPVTPVKNRPRLCSDRRISGSAKAEQPEPHPSLKVYS